MKGLLNAVWSWDAYFKAAFTELGGSTATDTASGDAIATTLTWISNGIWIIVGIVGLCGVAYSIWLGVQLARADEQGKRDDAKKHLITVIVALAITLVLVLFFLHILPAIVSAISGIDAKDTTGFIHF